MMRSLYLSYDLPDLEFDEVEQILTTWLSSFPDHPGTSSRTLRLAWTLVNDPQGLVLPKRRLQLLFYYK